MKCLSCLKIIPKPSYCIICAEPHCQECLIEFMCLICSIKEEEKDQERDLTTRVEPIVGALRRCMLPEDYNAVLAMIEDWKAGRISDVDRRLTYLSLKLKDSTMRYIRQVEDILCDPEYDINQELLENDIYRPSMRNANINFLIK